MPMNDGRRLDQNHRLETARPEPAEPGPKQAVAGAKAQPAWALASEYAKLMAEGDDLQFQRSAATKAEGQQGKDGGHERDHAGDATAVDPTTPCSLWIIDFTTGTSDDIPMSKNRLLHA